LSCNRQDWSKCWIKGCNSSKQRLPGLRDWFGRGTGRAGVDSGWERESKYHLRHNAKFLCMQLVVAQIRHVKIKRAVMLARFRFNELSPLPLAVLANFSSVPIWYFEFWCFCDRFGVSLTSLWFSSFACERARSAWRFQDWLRTNGVHHLPDTHSKLRMGPPRAQAGGSTSKSGSNKAIHAFLSSHTNAPTMTVFNIIVTSTPTSPTHTQQLFVDSPIFSGWNFCCFGSNLYLLFWGDFVHSGHMASCFPGQS